MVRAAWLRRRLAVAALVAAAACGDAGHQRPAALTPHGVGASDLGDDDVWQDDDEDEDDGPWLSQEAVTRVRHSFHRLEAAGELGEERWRLGAAPPPARYAHVSLRHDFQRGIYDGYAFEALVPVGDDGVVSDRFYVVRAGGIAGWQFLAGPFVMSDHVALTIITEHLAEQTIGIALGDRIAVELCGLPSAGYRWYAVAGPLGRPTQSVHPEAGSVRITFSPAAAALQPGAVYSIHLLYRRAGEARPQREFVAYVQVRI